MRLLLVVLSAFFTLQVHAEEQKWYEKIQLKGYAHFRYNRLLESNSDFKCSSCDRSIGDKQGFFLRRARLTFYGEVSDRVFIYVQPDYAQDVGNNENSQNYLQIRDAYFDYALTPSKELRLRTGISKVPFGFDNLQSSSNRAPLDRSDGINTAAPNERDTGLFLMYTPSFIHERFSKLSNSRMKGSGDYGMFAVGVYNGQTLNRSEENNDLHRVIRVTYPFELPSGQYIETSLQAYEGKYTIENGEEFYDQRTGASFILYPQPFGLQVEYNVGRGPEFDRSQNKVESDDLEGGYIQAHYLYQFDKHRLFPYVRYQEYRGGRKIDNGDRFDTTEWEFGLEWQPDPALELTVAYGDSHRKIESANVDDNSNEKGQLLRVQAQFNY